MFSLLLMFLVWLVALMLLPPSVADPDRHHFGTLDLDLHPHQGDKPDPDPHQIIIRIWTTSNKNKDPDLHQRKMWIRIHIKSVGLRFKTFVEKSIILPLGPDPEPHLHQIKIRIRIRIRIKVIRRIQIHINVMRMGNTTAAILIMTFFLQFEF
jgi:hypothetical protein